MRCRRDKSRALQSSIWRTLFSIPMFVVSGMFILLGQLGVATVSGPMFSFWFLCFQIPLMVNSYVMNVSYYPFLFCSKPHTSSIHDSQFGVALVFSSSLISPSFAVHISSSLFIILIMFWNGKPENPKKALGFASFLISQFIFSFSPFPVSAACISNSRHCYFCVVSPL